MSFEPQLFGDKGPVRDWVFFWYDPRPGWDKEKFSRSIFALDHDYKLFSDGRMYEISGADLKEEQLDLSKLTPGAEAARRKLEGAITKMMKGPISPAAKTEVDSYGRPVEK